MGMFSSKKKIYVSSSIWNMAGDIKDRTNYLKSTIVGNILSGDGSSMAEAITRTYQVGPGMGLRRYANWAKGSSGYDNLVGYVAGGISVGNSLDSDVVISQLPKGPNEYISLNDSDLEIADYTWWAEEHMVNVYPDLLFSEWYSEINDAADLITITFEDETTTTFTPTGYDPDNRYMYAVYQTISGGVNGPTTPGVLTPIPDEAAFPPIDGYTLFSDDTVVASAELNTTTLVEVTYSDSTPPTSQTDSVLTPVELSQHTTVYHVYTMIDTSNSDREIYQQYRQDAVVTLPPVVTITMEDIGGGVIKTTTTTVTEDIVEYQLAYQVAQQVVVNDAVSPYIYFRYEFNTGNATLDALFAVPSATGNYIPYIPIRLNNEFVADTDPVIYAATKKAYRRATSGGSLKKTLKGISDNPQLGDLDYIYVVYGVALNSPEQTARQYMYVFFDEMLATSPNSGADLDKWKRDYATAHESQIAYRDWANSRTSTSTTVPPKLIPYPSRPNLNIRTWSTSRWMNYHMLIQFNGARKESGNGLRPGHKKGDYWIENIPTTTYTKFYTDSKRNSDGTITVKESTSQFTMSGVVIFHQVADDYWEAINIQGLHHTNYVYKGKTVEITSSEALSDPEESGFIIPLHEQIFKGMRLVDATQLATACSYLVFNCYVVKKVKWYNSGWFKIVLIVAVIVICVVFPVAAPVAGLLGPAAAVGAAVGFSGAAAVVAGTVANAIAAMVLSKALSAVAGDTWGPILSAVVTAGVTGGGGMLAGGGFNFSTALTEFAAPGSLLKITEAVVGGYQANMQKNLAKMAKKTESVLADYRAKSLALKRKHEAEFGSGTRGAINPWDVINSSPMQVEGSSEFLSRTLMCGTDIAGMTNSLISDFTRIGISTDLS